MKKIIALLLTLIMIFSLTACGKLSAQGQKVSAMITGLETKTVTLTLKGEPIVGTVKSVEIPTDVGGGTFATAEIAKDDAKKTVIKFTGLEPGGGLIYLLCKDGNEVACEVKFMLSVGEDLTLNCGALVVTDGEFLDIETSGDNKEEADENVKFPDMDGDSSLIFLRNLGGEWIEGDYNADILFPQIMGTEEDFVKFQIVPVSEGEATVQFINIPIMKQVLATYVIQEKALDEEGKPIYSANVKEYVYTDYTMEEYLERRGQSSDIRKLKLFDPSFKVPKDYVIRGFALYNAKTLDVFEFDETKTIEEIKLPENIDTASIDLEIGDTTFEYVISKGTNLKAVCKKIDDVKATESVEDLTIGTKTVKYYHTTYGFGVAVWEDNGMVKQITFTSEKQTAESNKEILNAFI